MPSTLHAARAPAAALVLTIALGSCTRPPMAGTPEDLLSSGWRHFRLEEFDEAERAFQAALAQLDHPPTASPTAPPASPTESRPLDQRVNALYGLAMVASLGHHGDQSARAADLFRQVIALDTSPTRSMAAWAALAMVRDAHLPPSPDTPADPAALARGYDDLLRTYPDTPAAEEAFLYRTTLLVQTLAPADAERAVDDLTAYLEAHPGARLRTALLTVLSSACETLHRYPDALKAAIAAVEAKEIDPTNPWQTNILEYYRIGMMAQFDVGDFATARTYYRRFLAEYPRDQRAFNVQLLLNHLDDTEARLRAGLPPRELSEIARPATPPAPETRQSATAGAGGGR
jgi:tetratricopeptide (TPR) repeat protein